MSKPLEWQRVRGPIESGVGDLHTAHGYLIVPKVEARTTEFGEGLHVTGYTLHVPSRVVVGSVVYHGLHETLDHAKRAARDFRRKHGDRRKG